MKIEVSKLPSRGKVGGGESMMYRSVKVFSLGGWSRIKNRIHKIRSIYGLD